MPTMPIPDTIFDLFEERSVSRAEALGAAVLLMERSAKIIADLPLHAIRDIACNAYRRTQTEENLARAVLVLAAENQPEPEQDAP